MLSLETGILAAFAGLIFLAYFTMLHLLGSPHTPHGRSLRIIHRIAGSLGIVAYGAIMVRVALSLRHDAEAAYLLVLVILASLMLPLLVAKIVIVEKYPELRNRLFTIGTVLLIFGFAIFVTALVGGRTSGRPPAETGERLAVGRNLFATKCAKCHRLEKALIATKSVEEWRLTVTAMHNKDASWISKAEGDRIVEFLTAIGAEGEHD